MNLKCFFGFHDYEPVGIYWVWDKDPAYKYLEITSINVMQEYRCVRCGHLTTEIIQAYPLNKFKQEKVIELLDVAKIPHRIQYVIKKRDTLVSESKGRNA